MSRSLCHSCQKEVAKISSTCPGCLATFHPGCLRAKSHKRRASDGQLVICSGLNSSGSRSNPAKNSSAGARLSVTAPLTSSASSSRAPSGGGGSTTTGGSTTSLPAPHLPSGAVAASPPAQAADHLAVILEAIEAFKKEVRVNFDAFRGEVTQIAADIRSLTGRMSQLETKTGNIEASVSSLHKDVGHQRSKQEELVARMEKVELAQKTFAEALASAPTSSPSTSSASTTSTTVGPASSEVQALRTQVRKLQADQCGTEAIVSGLPESKNEDLKAVVEKIASTLGAPIAASDIIRVARIRGSPAVDRPRLVHLRLASRTARDALLAAKRKKRDLVASEIEAALGASRIQVNEYLPRDTWALLRKVRAVARSRGYRHVWHRSGEIRVRKDGNSAVIVITAESEISAKLP